MRKVYVSVILLVAALTAFILFNHFMYKNRSKKDTGTGTSVTEPYLTEPVQTDAEVSLVSETEITASEQTTTVPVITSEEETTAITPSSETTQFYEIKDGNYRAAFDDIIIAGDSLVKAIEEYGILDDDQVLAEIGAHTWHLSNVTDQIVASNPRYLILHYGENELDEAENAVYFINRYKECIERLKEELPDTEIFVGSIFPVQEKAYYSEPYTVNIPYYNELLKEMAEELGVHFIDYDPWWDTLNTDYYEPDGIHPVRSFYTEEYLPYVYNLVLNTK
ncbi:MAG: hypothetical protein IKG30_05345 [Clostridiales bacterium]|nr:hypothetical protein [Clostridiales bacterium]